MRHPVSDGIGGLEWQQVISRVCFSFKDAFAFYLHIHLYLNIHLQKFFVPPYPSCSCGQLSRAPSDTAYPVHSQQYPPMLKVPAPLPSVGTSVVSLSSLLLYLIIIISHSAHQLFPHAPLYLHPYMDTSPWAFPS